MQNGNAEALVQKQLQLQNSDSKALNEAWGLSKNMRVLKDCTGLMTMKMYLL